MTSTVPGRLWFLSESDDATALQHLLADLDQQGADYPAICRLALKIQQRTAHPSEVTLANLILGLANYHAEDYRLAISYFQRVINATRLSPKLTTLLTMAALGLYLSHLNLRQLTLAQTVVREYGGEIMATLGAKLLLKGAHATLHEPDPQPAPNAH